VNNLVDAFNHQPGLATIGCILVSFGALGSLSRRVAHWTYWVVLFGLLFILAADLVTCTGCDGLV
jgi:hypothetical protein